MSDPRDDDLRDDDEEAFHWAGDEVGGREGSHLPVQQTARDAAEAPADDERAPAGPPARAGMALLTGIFALLYLTLTVGWILGTQYTSAGTGQLLPQVLWQFGEFTAIIAAPMWFGTTVLLTASKPGVRAGFLMLGLGVLLPWPVLPLLAVGS
ncbi:MAG: hypothetical protein AB7K08_06855 [Microbacteriaceae bacterium]